MRDKNHQLTGSKNSRIETNCTKLSHVFSEHDVTFEGEDSVYNIFTKKVLPMGMADRFLQVKEIEQTKYEEFAKEKLKGEGSIWNTIKDRRIATSCRTTKLSLLLLITKHIKLKKKRSS